MDSFRSYYLGERENIFFKQIGGPKHGFIFN
jgi:hypothetical protein